jgi:ketosteroid isomerase-like protein
LSQEDVEIVRRAFAAGESDGLDGLLPYLDPDIEWTTTGAFVEAGTYRGHEGVRRYLGAMYDEFEELRNELVEVIEAGSQFVVVSRITGRGKRSGAPVELILASIGSVSDGKIVRIRNYPSREKALEAAGLKGQDLAKANEEVVARLVEAWNRADVEAFLDLFHPDCEVIFPPEVPEPGPFRGHAELRGWVEGFLAAWETHRADVVELIAKGGIVFAMLHLTGRGSGSGIELDETDAHVFTFGGGKIARWRNFSDRTEALKAVGIE